jgi:16S rRNA (uracil1498-N3)-methyltransferase
VLDGPEGHHAARVRRIAVGERVLVVDGAGVHVEGPVVEVRRDAVVVAVDVRGHQPAPRPRLVVVQALAKGDRGERAVEAMTEVGVDVIVPWAAARCVTTWQGDRGAKALGRWRTIAREAAKQARRSWFPDVAELESTEQVCGRIGAAALAVVCHESARPALATTAVPNDGDLVVVIGPEGGLTDDEVTMFTASGATAYRLGPTVLRTSTAGVVAASILLGQSRWLSES